MALGSGCVFAVGVARGLEVDAPFESLRERSLRLSK